jgi:peroxiredoxin
MHHNHKPAILTTLFIFISLVFFPVGCQKEVGAGAPAPAFSLSDLSGRPTSLEQHRGRVVLLDFWATWCPPCRVSIPELIEIQNKFAEKGLVILGISMDDPQMVSDDLLRAFKKQAGINYPILRVNEKVLKDYFLDERISIPTMFVIDAKGRITDKLVGFNPGAYEKSVRKLLK